jgi:hypothetical protein
MTLLQREYFIDARMRDHAVIGLEEYAKSHILQGALEHLVEREDFFETEEISMGIVCKFKAHVFSEAELAEYKNRVITEFMGNIGVFATRPNTTQENHND